MFVSFDNLELPVVAVGEVSTNYGANFATHNLIGRKPKLQYVAMNARQVSLKLRYHCLKGDVQKQRKELLNKAREHQAGVLAFGGGIVLGNFVIESISETFTQTDGNGKVMVAEYDVTFKESGNEAVKANAPAVKTDKVATAANTAKKSTTQAKPPKVSGNASQKQKATTAKQVVRQSK